MLPSIVPTRVGTIQRLLMPKSSYQRCFMNLPPSGKYDFGDNDQTGEKSQDIMIDGYPDEVSELVQVDRYLIFLSSFWPTPLLLFKVMESGDDYTPLLLVFPSADMCF